MTRRLTALCVALVLVAGCSSNTERRSASLPTSPSAAGPGSLLGLTSVAPGGVSGKFDVSFPPRNDSFDFRNLLETKYATGLGRAAAATFVDKEGEVVWTQEYMRYRANGCDHATAVARVMAQIDGNTAGAVCGAPPDGLVTFPPRTESFDFRRQLESRYQQFNRGASSSSVDPEGGVIWTQEYLRYRVNACDHPTAVQKVFSQIDGGGVAPTCFVPPCVFTITPAAQSVSAAGGTFTAIVTRSSGENCSYGSESLDPFVSIVSGGSGSDATTTLTYTVAPNFGGARATAIRIRWTNNSTRLEINQDAGTNAAFTMTDPNAGPGTTSTCLIKVASTPCTFNVTGTFGSSAIYTWHIDYNYPGGGGASHDFSSSTPSFTFTQMCGQPGSTVAGVEMPLNVTLTVTDGASSTTVQSGVAGQPPLTIRFFTC